MTDPVPNELLAALRDAGHGDLANSVRARDLAAELRALGRDDAADVLEGDAAPATPQPQGAPASPSQAEHDAATVAEALKASGVGGDWRSAGEL